MSVASASEINSAAITAGGITPMNLPITPATNAKGTKAITVVNTAEKILGTTS